MYKKIAAHPTPLAHVPRAAGRRRACSPPRRPTARDAEFRELLDDAQSYARDFMPRQQVFAFGGAVEGPRLGRRRLERRHRACRRDVLREVADGVHAHARTASRRTRRCASSCEQRAAMVRRRRAASTGAAPRRSRSARSLLEGTAVRLSGQDSGRGTFSHRHAVLHDVENGARYVPLEQHPRRPGARSSSSTACCRRTPCSASSTASASADPRKLVIWEAQFGDFANGAQVDHRPVHRQRRVEVAAHERPRACCCRTATRGRGPSTRARASSAILQLCAENNMQVVQPDHAGAVLPRAAPPDAPHLPQAARSS